MGIENVHPPASPQPRTLNYRSGAEDSVQQRDVARGCAGQVFATLVSLACLMGFFTFAWFAVALLLLAMYPPEAWETKARVIIAGTAVLTAVSAMICFLGALRMFPVKPKPLAHRPRE